MPDQTGLELISKQLGETVAGEGSPVIETEYFRGRATLLVDGERIREVLERLRGIGYSFMASLHGLDYFPEEPRLGVCYELLDMAAVDRLTVKVRLPLDGAEVDSVTPEWPTANHQERVVYDMFGVVFRGHPDLRRILMPEDYVGHPQRRDFPTGGEPVLFTYNEDNSYGKWQ